MNNEKVYAYAIYEYTRICFVIMAAAFNSFLVNHKLKDQCKTFKLTISPNGGMIKKTLINIMLTGLIPYKSYIHALES